VVTKSQARRSAQTAIWRIGETLVRLLAPIMTFTSEEVWEYLPKDTGRAESAHLALFPSAEEILGDVNAGAKACEEKTAEAWTTLRSVRDQVLKALEEARNNKLIGTGLEAQVTIAAPDPTRSALPIRCYFQPGKWTLDAGSISPPRSEAEVPICDFNAPCARFAGESSWRT